MASGENSHEAFQGCFVPCALRKEEDCRLFSRKLSLVSKLRSRVMDEYG